MGKMLARSGVRVRTQISRHMEQLLRSVLDFSESQIVTVRKPNPSTRLLELVTYAAANEAPEVDDRHFRIPKTKTFFGSGIENPMDFWGVDPLDNRSRCKSDDPAEQNFIDWIREKSWFPLAANGETLLCVLLRGESTPYSEFEILQCWAEAQYFLSGLFDDSCHSAYVDLFDQAVGGANYALEFSFDQLMDDLLALGWSVSGIIERPASEGELLFRQRKRSPVQVPSALIPDLEFKAVSRERLVAHPLMQPFTDQVAAGEYFGGTMLYWFLPLSISGHPIFLVVGDEESDDARRTLTSAYAYYYSSKRDQCETVISEGEEFDDDDTDSDDVEHVADRIQMVREAFRR